MRLGLPCTVAIALIALSCSRQDAPTKAAPSGAATLPTTEAVAKAIASTPAITPSIASGARFIGRFDTRAENEHRFAWSGSAIVGRFRGTGISARLRDEGMNHFAVVVDGQPKGILKTSARRDIYPLVSGLSDGTHEVALYRRTEAKVGETVFLGFDATGELLPPPPAPERRIEIIGDSISAGYGNEGRGPGCTFVPSEENEYLTYGALAARALKAEHATIAWSGKTIGEMTDFWERTLPARADSRWDHASWVPQLVVINLGTNNFAIQDPGESRFVQLYTNFYDKVRKAYPKAFVVCALGPMLTDNYPEGKRHLTLARAYMRTTMKKLRESGETNLEFLEFSEQNHADGLGCGFHPSTKTHQLMADRLINLARERLQW